MWILYVVGSSFFAGITAVLAKCGIKKRIRIWQPWFEQLLPEKLIRSGKLTEEN